MQQAPITKYRAYPTIDLPDRRWPSSTIAYAPFWCSVDLRDGNQALPVPMTVDEKLELFQVLVDIGFKEIEVGFPSASDTEYTFCRRLIEEKLIPDDVAIQVLVQCREHLIRRTFEAIDGAPNAIVHFYNSTNPLQRKVTFNKSRDEIRDIAVEAARLCRELETSVSAGTTVRYQYSPESFSDTELEFSLEICQAVCAVIDPSPDNRIILNLPATVELFTPNVHADQIEWFCRQMEAAGMRDQVIISLHTHNDRGTGVAATELGLMAGADRVEGTLFGNGERTGNLDIVTVALNMYTQGVDPLLDFSDLVNIRSVYERTTRMTVHERHPYAGDLVFTAFSGSHQDAIKKGMDARKKALAELSADSPPEALPWAVPYLPIDSEDIGRTYKAIIRINSQSGKGGVAYILEREYGFELPRKMHPEFGKTVNDLADAGSKELSAEEIRDILMSEYVNRSTPVKLVDYDIHPEGSDHDHVNCKAVVENQGVRREITGEGNGPIASLVDALDNAGLKVGRLVDFRQHSVSGGSKAKAASYIQIERISDGKTFWGMGLDTNIEFSGLKALVSAYNRASEG